MRNRKSFTLMELLVVITIIAVLAAVSIPQVIGVIQRAQDVAIRTSMRVMLTEATRISILEGDLSRIHCNTGGHPDILAICDTVRAHSPHPAQLRSSATTRTFWIRAPLHDGTFWRVDHRGFAGRDLGDYIARWDMDEGSDQVVGDATGTNPGTRGSLVTSDPQDPTWGVGYLTFDGNDFVTVPHHPSLVVTTGLTMEVWINKTADVNWQTILAKSPSPVNDYRLLFSDARRAYGFIRIAGTFIGTPHSNVALSLNNWYHIVTTYDGLRLRFYINGVEQGVATSVTGSIENNAGLLAIGANADFTNRFHGFIDEVRIYNRALTAEEVRASFLRGR